MKAKQLQTKHWAKSKYNKPFEDKLSELWARAGMVGKDGDHTALRIFRLESLLKFI